MLEVTIGNNLKREKVIVPPSTTLREVLEQHDVDYTRGLTNLDGATLSPGDLDKTFEELGVTSKCYLLNVVKADNAAKVTVIGNAVVITSSLLFEDIKLLEKYSPSSLKITNDEDEEVFVVCHGKGSMSKYGICFDKPSRDDEGFATVTGIIPEGVEDVKKYIADMLGVALFNLEEIEERAAADLPSVLGKIAKINEMISVM